MFILGDYTRRSYTYDNVAYFGGSMNIVERLPSCLVRPDLGPKLYIAYSKFIWLIGRTRGSRTHEYYSELKM